MVVIDLGDAKKIDIEVKYGYVFIEIEHYDGGRTKLEMSEETAKILKEKLDGKSEL